MANKDRGSSHVSLGTLLLWKSRDVSFSAVTIIILGYLSIYCTDALQMSAGVVGTILLVSRIIDAITDLIGGYIVDRTHTKLGKARPYEICIIFEWITTVLLFFANGAWSNTVKVIWVFVMYTTTYAIFNTLLDSSETPYIVRAFHGNRGMITKVSSYGGIISMVCSVIVSVIFPMLMHRMSTGASGMSSLAMWRRLIIMFAIPMMIIGILRMIFIKEDPKVDAQQQGKLDMHEALIMLKKNKYVWAFAGIFGFYGFVTGLSAGSYYFTYIIGDISKFGVMSMAGFIMAPLLFIFPKMIGKIGLGRIILYSGIISACGYLVAFFGNANFGIVFLGMIFANLLSLSVVYMKTLAVTDLGIYNEYLGYHRMEGTAGSLSGFLNKLMTGVGAGTTGWLLSLSGYIKGAGGNAALQPHSALFMIRSLFTLIPMLGVIVIILCALVFTKLENKLPEIQKELKQRHEGKEADQHAAN